MAHPDLRRAGLRRSGLRGARRVARRRRARRDCDRPGGRRARARGLEREAARHLPGRGARAPLRPPRLRRRRATALRRSPLGGGRRAPPTRRQLAGARGQALLHRDPGRPAARHPAPALPHGGAPAHRDRRRVAGRLHARRRELRRLSARRARSESREPDARHRRDDPGRPVQADHACARPAARNPGRAGNRQDRGRPAPGFVAPLYASRDPRALSRPRRRAEPALHGVRLARSAGARRALRRAAHRLGACRWGGGDARRPARGREAEGGSPARRRPGPRRRVATRERAGGDLSAARR